MLPIKRLFLAGFLMLLALLPVFSQTADNPPKPVDPIAPGNIIQAADTALRSLHDIETDLQSDNSVASVNEKLTGFMKKTDSFFKESSEILQANPSLDRLRFLNEAWTSMSGSLTEWKSTLARRSQTLSDRMIQIDQIIEVWQKTKPTIPSSPPELSQRGQAVLSLAQSLKPKILAGQKELLTVESKLAEEDSRINDMLTSIQQGNNQAVSNLFVQDSSPIWSSEFSGSLNQGLNESGESWETQSTALKTFLVWQKGKIFVQLLLAIILVAALFIARRKMRKWAGEDSQLKIAVQIFETPIATALLLTLGISGWIYPYAPNLWKGFLGAFLLIPTMIILLRLVERRLFPVLNSLVFFYFMDQLRLLANAQPGLLRMIFLVESICAIVFLAWLLLSFKKKRVEGVDQLSRAVQIGGRLALILIGVGLLANLAGYSGMGTLLLNGVLRSAYIAVIFYALLHVFQALVLGAFRSPLISRLGIVKTYRELLLGRIFRFFAVAAFLLWVTAMLELFSIREPIFNSIKNILWSSHSLGSLEFKIIDLIAFVFTIWISFQISRLIRFVLDHDVYPHFKLAQGVPYAISNVVHYSVLLLAFFMATASLGIDMTKFTILVSAFGVGIGFGLQNIINNFVSGLILLFERPVKVGDSVQVGDAVGTVRRIGIRASVLRTNNGSEIIVPNATLISTNVTNWTLSRQRRMIVIPISVPQDSKTDHIIDLLKKEASAHPNVLKDPAPQVLIAALAANLSLELRVWTAQAENWNQIRSELLLSINAALGTEGIKTA